MSKLLEQINKEKIQYQLSDLMEIKYGFGLPERNRVKGNIPVYASSGIVGFHNESKVKNSSIIIGRKGNVGSLAYSETQSYPIDTVFFVDEPTKNFDLKYLYYLLHRVDLPRYGGDSAVPGLNRETIYSIKVNAPSLVTQKKVAEILSVYDEKIENNNIIIKNLEATAQAIFDEWFVKFRFPGHEKTKFVGSEMGEIPEGWKVGNIEIILKRTPSGKTYRENELLKNGAVPVYDQSSKGVIGFHNDKLLSNASIENPVLIFGDHTCRMQLIFESFSLGPNTIPLIQKNGFSPLFGYFLAKDLIEQREYKRHWNELVSHKLIIPSSAIVDCFSKKVKIFFETVFAYEKENIFLKSQRDQLLAKVI